MISKDHVAQALRHRRDPLFLIDIAVPRDIDPACADVDDVFLYDIDDLNGVVSSNLEERMAEAERAEVIIDEEIAEFERWLESMEVVPTVAAIRAKAEQHTRRRAREGPQAPRRPVGEGDQDGRGAALRDRQQDAPRAHRAPQERRRREGRLRVRREPRATSTGSTAIPRARTRTACGLIRSILGRGEKAAPQQKNEMGDTVGF